jgi:hypothetical protein
MAKSHRDIFIAGEPPKIRVTWKCAACGCAETVCYWHDRMAGKRVARLVERVTSIVRAP